MPNEDRNLQVAAFAECSFVRVGFSAKGTPQQQGAMLAGYGRFSGMFVGLLTKAPLRKVWMTPSFL